MRKPLALLIFCLPFLLGQGYNIQFNPRGGAVVCTNRSTSTFNDEDDIGADSDCIATDQPWLCCTGSGTGTCNGIWLAGRHQTAALTNPPTCRWFIDAANSRVEYDVDSTTACSNDLPTILNSTGNGSIIDQYASAYLFSRSGGSMKYMGLALRQASQTQDVSDGYLVFGRDADATIWWAGPNYQADVQPLAPPSPDVIGTCELVSQTFDDTDTLATRISGTGTGTIMEVWVDPGAGDPDDWGASECCISESGGDYGPSDPGETVACTAAVQSITGGYVADTGAYVGVMAGSPTSDAAASSIIETWAAGSCE